MDNKWTVPFAIVVAGTLIAGAIYFSNKSTSQTQQQPQTGTPQKVTITLEPVSATEHILGNPAAAITVVEFSDTECPFCKQFHTTMHQVVDEYGKDGSLAWVYRHFPIPELHPKAAKESEALECAAELGGNDKFWAYTDKIYEITPSNNQLDAAQLPIIAKEVGLDVTAFNNCLSSGKHADTVEADKQEAVKAGGRGTPFSVLILKKKLTDDAEGVITQLAAQLRAQTGTDAILISQDKTKVAISGAFPYSFLKGIFDLILGRP